MKYRYIILLSTLTSVTGYLLISFRDGMFYNFENIVLLFPLVLLLFTLIYFIDIVGRTK